MSKQNNLTDYLEDLGDAIRYQFNTDRKLIPAYFATEVLNLPQGLKVPKVVNLINTDGVISWDVTGVEELSIYNPEITYIITFNGNVFETTNTYYNLGSYYDESKDNIAKIKVKINLTNPITESEKVPFWNFTKVDYIQPLGDWIPAWSGDYIYKIASNTQNDRLAYVNLYTGEKTTTTRIITYAGSYNRCISGSTAVTVGKNIYRIGGLGGSGMFLSTIDGYSILNTNTNTFTTRNVSGTNSKFWTPCATYCDGYIYVFGGNGIGTSNYLSNRIIKINTTTYNYEVCSAKLPGADANHYADRFVAVPYKGKIYLMNMGSDPNYQYCGTSVYEYDYENDILIKSDLELSETLSANTSTSNHNAPEVAIFKGHVYSFDETYINGQRLLIMKEINMDTFKVTEIMQLPIPDYLDDNPLYAKEEDNCIYMKFNNGEVYKLSYE